MGTPAGIIINGICIVANSLNFFHPNPSRIDWVVSDLILDLILDDTLPYHLSYASSDLIRSISS